MTAHAEPGAPARDWQQRGRWIAVAATHIQPRLVMAIGLSLAALALQNSPLRGPAFLASWDRGLFDVVAQHRRNTVGGAAPPVFLAIFGRKARGDWYAAHPEVLPAGVDPPSRTPLPVISGAMEDARRMQARAMLVDIDVAQDAELRPAPELAAFTTFLSTWSRDVHAPLVVLSRSRLPQAADELGNSASPSTPWDALIEAAPNLAWGAPNGEATPDGVTRFQHFYTCWPGLDGRPHPLPSAPLLASLATVDGRPGVAKAAALRAMNAAVLCAGRQEHAGGASSYQPGPGFSIEIGQRRLDVPSQRGLINYHLDTPDAPGPGAPLPRGDWAPGPRAISVWEPSDLSSLTPELGRGAIVVLGSSQPQFPDLHWTPFGEISGALLLANCVRGLALSGPIRGIPWWVILPSLAALIVATHEFLRIMAWANRLACDRLSGPIEFIGRSLTSEPMAKVYALALIYVASVVTGAVLLGGGYWQMSPFIGASIYLVVADLDGVLAGGRRKSKELTT